jgi:hypothetical protein
MNISRLAIPVLAAALLGGCTASAAEAPAAQRAPVVGADGDPVVVQVYKSPTCSCCGKWEEHMHAHGFQLETHIVQEPGVIKAERGLPPTLASCHTSIVDGYVVEGHVPQDAIRKLLAERPAVAGIAVPGMPAGSPGMEGPTKRPYDVIAFTAEGAMEVFMRK